MQAELGFVARIWHNGYFIALWITKGDETHLIGGAVSRKNNSINNNNNNKRNQNWHYWLVDYLRV